ncbi:phage head spike fiber domain-containing protein [Roseomonas sp. USHLN139]|uniref:phage head spike fiber domain-containing protein n=1 Tax=Roseomonas sp. USHLN139 TaxID=3081298 RepID=UPI003B02D736
MAWLVRAEPWDAVAGAVRPLYYSDVGFLSKPQDTPGDVYWERRIGVGLSMQAKLFADGQAGGEGDIDYGDLTLENGDGALDALAELDWDGRLVEVRFSAKDAPVWADFAVAISGTVESLTPGDELTIKLRSLKALLDDPLQPLRYAGTGGAEGLETLKDRRRPMTLGIARQAELVVEDTANLVVAWDSTACGGILALKDKGGLLVAGPDYPTREAMLAAPMGAYGYVTCDALGRARLGAEPSWPITGDLLGRSRGGNLVANGRLGQSAAGWTLGAGWSWASAALLASDSPLEAGWTPTGIASRVAAPGLYGDGRACLVTESTASGQHTLASAAVSFAAGSQTTLQVKARAVAGAPCLQLLYGGSTHGTNAWANFDLASGTLGSKGAAATATITALGGGVYLCTLAAPVTAAGSNPAYAILVPTAAAARSPSYAGAGRQLELQDVQLEAAATASDYGGRLVSAAGIAGTASQAVATVAGRLYVAKAMVTRTAGSLALQVGGATLATAAASGRLVQIFRATGSSTTVAFSADSAFAGSVDDVVVTEWLGRFGDLAQLAVGQSTGLTAGDFAPGTVDAVNAVAPQRVGLWYDGSGEMTIRQAIDQLATGPGAWWICDDARRILLGRLEPPAAAPDFEFDEHAIHEILPREVARRLKLQTIGYGRRWRPLSDTEILGTILGAEREALRTEWLTEAYADSTVAAQSLLAREERIDGSLDDKADAAQEAQRRVAMHGPRRRMFEITVDGTDGLRVGMTVRISHSRFGLAAGRNFVVTELDRDAESDTHSLILWG